MPTISVIMPAYNASPYIRAAIDSILGQTLRDFELIVIDDGSTDDTGTLVAAISDPRIRLVHNDGNQGLIYTRNLGVQLARGEFIAFLDSDDIAFPRRLERQHAYLLRRPDLAAVGAWVQPMNADGSYRDFVWRYPGDSAFVKSTLLFRAYINTSSFFVRTAVMRQLPFSPDHALGEDYDMYLRCVRSYRVENVPEVLTAYRLHATNITRTKAAQLTTQLNAISARALGQIGLTPSPDELTLHRYLEWLGSNSDPTVFDAANAWLRKIMAANERTGLYERAALHQAAAERWLALCHANARFGFRAMVAFFQGPMAIGRAVPPLQYLKFFGKSLLCALRLT
ncbi:glycosyltransferase family 2 protein [Duganella sp. FT3S]|uniref:Glycosyltransferase family 2 protein n=1 Tax=Rugamonas fusca TaxID=2758568 RepID=A0A7W2EKK1_9BURK|nr:glycosyltransferase family 2 protein [Rugamonas fusca]MBA5607589.1 glycosyltransferase family 2 protein [Rugamonas fusca]